MLFEINPQLAGYKDKQIPDLYASLQRKIAALPGVNSVSYATHALLDGGSSTWDMRVEGRADKSTVEVQILSVGPEYFQTMKIPLLQGRLLTQADTNTTRRALVNRMFVQKYVFGRNPLGLHFGGDDPKDPQLEIVGVVGDTKYDTLRGEDAPTAYMPLASDGATFAVRTAPLPASLMPAVRNVVNSIDANLPVMRMRTQADSINRLLFNERLGAWLLGLFAMVGLMLACIGLYGLLSYEVERRTREIGIRTALGTQRSTIWSMVVRHGLRDGGSARGLWRGTRCYAGPDELALFGAPDGPGHVRSHYMPASADRTLGLFTSRAARHARRSNLRFAVRVATRRIPSLLSRRLSFSIGAYRARHVSIRVQLDLILADWALVEFFLLRPRIESINPKASELNYS
jgi:hypothetical protein